MHHAAPAIVLAAAVFSTAALAKTAPKPKPLPPVRYVCEDGTRLRVQFSTPGTTPGTAVLEILGTGKQLNLTQAESADGGRYTADKTEFWDKGGTAGFTQNGTALTCRVKK